MKGLWVMLIANGLAAVVILIAANLQKVDVRPACGQDPSQICAFVTRARAVACSPFRSVFPICDQLCACLGEVSRRPPEWYPCYARCNHPGHRGCPLVRWSDDDYRRYTEKNRATDKGGAKQTNK